MRIILFVIALLSFAIYGYAIRRWFSRDHGVDWRMNLLQLLGTLFAVGHLWMIWQLPTDVGWRSKVAIVVYGAALLVFFAAKRALIGYRLTLAFSGDSPQRIISSGIYSRVRHPFYLAYTLTWTAGAIAAPSNVTIGSTLCMTAIYIFAARGEEGKFARSALNESYARYREHTGMLWPRVWP
jgi:protein-S-isoprenylcysteine O-methyltransferase Ste14